MSAAGRPRRSWRPEAVRAVYDRFAGLYDAWRAVWSRATSGAERSLDRLFRERIASGARVLELGPGTGVNIARLRRCAPHFGHYTGVDLSEAMLRRARRRAGDDPRIELRTGDITAASQLPQGVDFIVCTWVLSHLEDPLSVVQTAIGCLAPGGSAVFVFWTEPRSAALRMLMRAFATSFRAAFIDPAPFAALPECERIEQHSGGMATLALYRRPGAPAAAARAPAANGAAATETR